MADDVTLGELERRQSAWERRSAQEHASLEQHINDLASQTVPMGVYQADQRALQQTLARLEREHGEDLAEMRREHADALAQLRRAHAEKDRARAQALRELHERIEEQARTGAESRRHWRELLFIGVLPSLVTAIGILLTLWMNGGGKH